MKNILIPTDFSKNAYHAVVYATQLYEGLPCTFHLLNTFEVNTPMLTGRIDTSKGKKLYEDLKEDPVESLAHLKTKITEAHGDRKHLFKTVSISKPLLPTIAKTITAENIDLVVMGTKGATGAKRFFMGSNTVKVIKGVRACPVLAVPMGITDHKNLKIGFSTDMNHFLSQKELRQLLEFSGMSRHRTYIIHVLQNGQLSVLQLQNLKHLRNNLGKDQVSFHALFNPDNKTTTISYFIEKEAINLLVMLNTKNSFLKKLAREPIVEKIGIRR